MERCAGRGLDRVLEEAALDQAAADEARDRFRRDGIAPLRPDDRIDHLLTQGEDLIAVHRAALVDPRESSFGPALAGRKTLAGDLCITSRRVLVTASPDCRLSLAFDLEAVEDGVIAGDRLLLVLGGGQGLALRVAQPRLLWAEIAAARSAARAGNATTR